jgi:tetratricopeptide (TPR) repeat protein
MASGTKTRWKRYGSAGFSICLFLWFMTWAATLSAQTTQAPSGESTSRPAEPPTPPDAPSPDQGTMTTPPAKSAAKRTLNKLDPHCIDVIFHTCWSSPAADAAHPAPDAEKQAADDINVGYYYLKDKNYVAAESRLKEALELKPDSPAALIGLAQAQQKLGKRDAARQNYEAYLKLSPDGPDADKVKKALAQLK